MTDQKPTPLAQQLEGKPTRPHWERIGTQKRFGVCVPLFSLRSERDFGVGDTADIRGMVDWCREIGASVLQILPVNDMGSGAEPYSALSAFALDPLYLALDEFPGAADDPAWIERIRKEGAEFNKASRVEARIVRWRKMELAHEWYSQYSNALLKHVMTNFTQKNPWLENYLLYRVIKEVEEFRSWEDWHDKYVEKETREAFRIQHADRMDFHRFLQMELARQFVAAHDYALQNGVFIEGDIPILVNRDSADVWAHMDQFHMDTVAGAPPDMYSEDGQNWGFPTYNWPAMRADNYQWWRGRLHSAEQFMDLVRIDHVVGFFRIWTIRHGEQTGKNGWFVPQDESQWGEHGRRILSMMLESSTMLPLAEDLGTIPHVTRDTMRDMGICGLKVQRWEKWWEGDRTFITPGDYEPLAVATLSTHDSETFADWWEHNPMERGELWGLLGNEGEVPQSVSQELGIQVMKWFAGVNSLFVVHLLQDLLHPFELLSGPPATHRINLPGVVRPENWSWRCPVTLEKLQESRQMNETLALANQRPD